jgi:uncharacterized membrane protein YdjX (TVP38/TMEM64 family)
MVRGEAACAAHDADGPPDMIRTSRADDAEEGALHVPTPPETHAAGRARPAWLRVLPLAAIVLAAVGAYATGLHRAVGLDTLSQHRAELEAWVAARPLAAPLAFVCAYALVAALGLPLAIFFTLAGGFLFGTWAGGALVVVGATLGATGVFLAARTALREPLARMAGPRVKAFEAGFRQDGFSYMLVLRLLPLFPFWLVNLVPALLGVGARTYVLATFLGIIPGSFVYASVGAGLGHLIDRGGSPDLGAVFTPEVLGPLAGLALLSLAPVVYRRLRRDRG